MGVGQGMSFRSSLGLAANSASPHKQATAISMYYIFGYIMTAVLPLLTNATSVFTILCVMVVLTLGSLLVSRVVVKVRLT